MNKALFLDRDGVVLQFAYLKQLDTISSVKSHSQVYFVHGIIELIKLAQKLDYQIILISNQPDLALKKISKLEFEKVSLTMRYKLNRERIKLTAEYYCFHHPFAKIKELKKTCQCRKPKPGLLIKAATQHQINLKKSFFIGDGVNDILAAKKAGCQSILFGNCLETGYLKELQKRLGKIKPNYFIKNLKEAEKIITKQ